MNILNHWRFHNFFRVQPGVPKCVSWEYLCTDSSVYGYCQKNTALMAIKHWQFPTSIQGFLDCFFLNSRVTLPVPKIEEKSTNLSSKKYIIYRREEVFCRTYRSKKIG
ncbi:hypothetical protein GWI33_017194 [Rhynchophorus ferrugineus]|uniref:Uncharacterized protein n=1 Tax=Rhynchophorus ferrugineus TaxID=354439 RepID=A0A834I9P1_RHYFE|nr:hypothetical protein GWI33_017194 [Rhynchophorus ferrugineus]